MDAVFSADGSEFAVAEEPGEVGVAEDVADDDGVVVGVAEEVLSAAFAAEESGGDNAVRG